MALGVGTAESGYTKKTLRNVNAIVNKEEGLMRRVVNKEPEEVVPIDEVSRRKIYAFISTDSVVHISHRVEKGTKSHYIFVPLIGSSNSKYTPPNEDYTMLRGLITSVEDSLGRSVFESDSQEELLVWALTEIGYEVEDVTDKQ